MKVAFTVEQKQISIFFELLATGIIIRTQTGCSIRELLSDRLGIDTVYIDQRIQTIFLNGRAIDDIDQTIIEDGSVLALSGAMPGLAGAVFRKGGMLSSMRSVAAVGHNGRLKQLTDGDVVLKMFNQIATDIGPVFLKKGILINGQNFRRFLNQRIQDILTICAAIDINGKKIPIRDALSVDFNTAEVLLSIKTA
jgi:hypothetical protein